MPPSPRYLTPRQQYTLQQQSAEIERTIREREGLDEDQEVTAPLPPARQGGTWNPFSPTPRRALTPAQQQILRNNNIDLSLP